MTSKAPPLLTLSPKYSILEAMEKTDEKSPKPPKSIREMKKQVAQELFPLAVQTYKNIMQTGEDVKEQRTVAKDVIEHALDAKPKQGGGSNVQVNLFEDREHLKRVGEGLKKLKVKETKPEINQYLEGSTIEGAVAEAEAEEPKE